MRILLSTITYFPTIGGADDYVRSIARGLRDRGHEVAVITSDLEQHVAGRRHPPGTPDVVDGIPVTRCTSRRLPGHVYPFYPAFFRAARAFRPDLVHGFGLGYWSADAAASLSPRLPVVISPTGGRYRAGRLYGILRRYLFTRTRRVPAWTALSWSERSQLVAECAPDHPPILMLPPAVDLAEFTAPHPDPFPGVPVTGRLLFAGRLSRGKGVVDLLEAFERVRALRPATLILAGPDYGLDVSLERPGVVVAGALSRERLVAAYGHCDLFVLPSYHEGYGIVIAEAMAAGRPVIAYANSSQPELCRDGVNGTLVPTGDTARLAQAISALLDDADLRARLGGAGRRRALDEFGLDRLIDRVESIYRAVLSGRAAVEAMERSEISRLQGT